MAPGQALTLFVGFGFEVFAECPHAWQRGLWFDREPGQWARIGLGRLLLGVVRRR